MTTRERGQVFGELAEQYHRVRPGYPAELVTDLLELSGAGPVLEVGAGTGKATALFAAHDIDLTCLEPDPRMAAVLRRSVPGVPVIESTFEAWAPEEWPDLAGIEELFTDLRTLRYRGSRSYTPAEYRAHLHSISLYRMLDDDRRETVIDDTIATIEAHGSTIDFAVHTFVALARRPA